MSKTWLGFFGIATPQLKQFVQHSSSSVTFVRYMLSRPAPFQPRTRCKIPTGLESQSTGTMHKHSRLRHLTACHGPNISQRNSRDHQRRLARFMDSLGRCSQDVRDGSIKLQLLSELLEEYCDSMGIDTSHIAAGSHWQLGKVERHGHWFAKIFDRVCDECQPTSEGESVDCVLQTQIAKNALRSEAGASPYQLVFGRNPRIVKICCKMTLM